MQETDTQVVAKPPRKRPKIRPLDIVIFGVVIVIVIVLASVLIRDLHLRRDVSQARIVTDKVIQAVDKQDGSAARSYGSDTFMQTYSADALTKQFKSIQLVTSAGTPSIDHQTVSPVQSGKNVYIIYKYPPKLAKQPFYIRVAANNKTGSWRLIDISGSADESSLLVN